MEAQAPRIIYFVNEYGPLTHEHLCTLTRLHPISIRRILPRLVEAQKLSCASQGMHKPHVYATRDISKRKDFTHDLARATVATALHNTGLLTYWTAPLQKFPKHKAVNEDARFELTIDAGDKLAVLHFFLEVDTATEGIRQIEDKFKRYLALKDRSQVLFVLKFNPALPRRSRPATLAELAERYIKPSDKHLWKKFLFADLDKFAADPTGQICHIPYSDQRYSILPSLVK